jgi:hypothetical protein
MLAREVELNNWAIDRISRTLDAIEEGLTASPPDLYRACTGLELRRHRLR